MVDNRPDTNRSMRTPLARVKGLGPAGHGAEHWWAHRMTAVSNIPLVVAFTIIVASLTGRSYEEAVDIVAHPLVAIILVLADLGDDAYADGRADHHRGLCPRQGLQDRRPHRQHVLPW